MELTRKRHQILSGSMLKLIAVIAMVIDHSALLFAPELPVLQQFVTILGRTFTPYELMRDIGRIAFPIFCFLIAEGFFHTGNKGRYALRLGLFALLSEVPFDLMLSGSAFSMTKQNVFVTLFLGLLMLYLYETVEKEGLKFLLMFAVGVATVLLKTDYGLRGVLLVLLLHLLRGKIAVQTVLAYPLLSGGLPALCGFLPIALYNGERGFIRSAPMKLAFYVFYPVHILLLLAIKYFVL